jgi:SNF2 family DNA or RNA helicase
VALYRVFRYCNILVERGAILPRLLYCEDDYYKILWLPALLNESVKNIFTQLLDWLPDDLVLVQNYIQKKTSSRKNKKTDKTVTHTQNSSLPEGEEWLIKKDEALQLLCSFFINHSVKRCYNYSPIIKTKRENDAKIIELFFNDVPVCFSNFNEKEIPNTIQLWLKRFYLSDKNFIPIISVHELDNKFEVEVLVQRNDERLRQKESLFSFMLSESEENKMNLLKDLNMLSEYYPDLNKIIQSQGKQKLVYKQKSFSDVLLKILPALKLFGIKALLPKSLQQLLRPQVSLKLKPSTKNKTYFSLDGLIDYDWKVAVGDMFMSKSEFEQLAKSTWGLVKIREQYMMVDEDEMKKIIRRLEQPLVPSSFQLLQAALSGEYENATVQIDDELKKQIKNLLKEEQTPLPSSLQATLRPYQHRGFNWIYKNAKLGLGSLLADDMGLGKTIQVITALLKFKEEGALSGNPALVIVPTTLLTNWMNEIKKFAPELRAYIYHGSARKLILDNVDVILTTYGIVRSDKEKLSEKTWYVIIADESQNIKNPEVAQTKAVKSIKAKIKIALSGTPVENRLSEYWSIFDFINPNYLGSINWFNGEYAKPIELNQDRKKLEKFKLITSPFIMRRVKTDKNIISDLPNKVENNQFCNLTKEQAALYQNITRDLMQQVEIAEGISRRGLILKLLITLKQICNHPAQYLKNDNYAPELSGKIMLMFQLLETIYENNEKVLIFSQFKEMGDIPRQIIHDHFGKKALQLHGGCSRKERDEMIHAFQNNKQNDTFILSIKAGGTGLNLTAAANVIHYDLWWNPAVESQATDRAFRIGQKQNVMVYRLITKGTLEEKIDDMLRSKKQLANLTVSTGEKWIGELSDKELKSLVTLEES